MQEQAICAIASPHGSGAIAVIRVSGENSIEKVSKIFRPKNKNVNIVKSEPYRIYFGEIVYKRKVIDEVLVSIFKAPHSYTGEDSVEISCHGSEYIQQKIIEVLLNEGIQLAQPGEFTKRAFLNGKLDLSQAEGVADIIASETEAEHRLAIQQLKGGFSKELAKLRERMVHFVSFVELELDFSEEDVEFADRTELKQLIESVHQLLSQLIDSFRLGNVIKKGVPIAIVGRPNSGKSTLLNAILNENRAIVSEIPGTTRDTIEETVNIGGVHFRFIDTAGLRETTDEIEKIGVERAKEKIDSSSIYIYLFDINSLNINEVKSDLKQLNNNVERIVVANKTDLASKTKLKELKKLSIADIYISAKEKEGVGKLKNALLKKVNKNIVNPNGVVVTNARHYEALKKAKEAVERSLDGLNNDLPTDLLTIDIRQAIHYIGEITGEITNDEILGNIFKNFCIGK